MIFEIKYLSGILFNTIYFSDCNDCVKNIIKLLENDNISKTLSFHKEGGEIDEFFSFSKEMYHVKIHYIYGKPSSIEIIINFKLPFIKYNNKDKRDNQTYDLVRPSIWNWIRLIKTFKRLLNKTNPDMVDFNTKTGYFGFKQNVSL